MPSHTHSYTPYEESTKYVNSAASQGKVRATYMPDQAFDVDSFITRAILDIHDIDQAIKSLEYIYTNDKLINSMYPSRLGAPVQPERIYEVIGALRIARINILNQLKPYQEGEFKEKINAIQR